MRIRLRRSVPSYHAPDRRISVPYQQLWACLCENPLIIDTNKTTLASLLKRKGYATACIEMASWIRQRTQAGLEPDLKPGPLEVGFDYLRHPGRQLASANHAENHRVVGLDPPIR